MNEIDILMDLDPLELTPANIDQISAYHRENRSHVESGLKPKKETGPKLSLDQVMGDLLAIKKPVQELKRRF